MMQPENDMAATSPQRIRIFSSEVLDDIRSAAWLESEIHPEYNLHQRHEMADLCEKDNIERVWRVLGICVAEIRDTLRGVLADEKSIEWRNDIGRPAEWTFDFAVDVSAHAARLLKEKIHEYLVAMVMADRLRVLMPSAAENWKEEGKECKGELATLSATISAPRGARRPLWPL